MDSASLIRLKAWLVTGAPARGLAFALGLAAALTYAAEAGLRRLTRR